MSAQNVAASVCLEEIFNSVWSKLHNVASAVWVSNEVRLNSKVLVAICWVRPQDVYDELLFRS